MREVRSPKSSAVCQFAATLKPRALRAVAVAAVCASAVFSSPEAQAQDDATTAAARERFREGVQYFDKGQYDKSRTSFLQAYALKRHPAVLLNLGQAELRSGHEVEAARHFAQYLREVKDPAESERQNAEAGLATAKAAVAEVLLTVDDDGAVVTINGATEGTSPLPGTLYLPPGQHTLIARKDGRESMVQVTGVAGQSTTVTLRVKAPAGAPTTPAAPAATPVAPVAGPVQPPPAEPTRAGYQPFFSWLGGSPLGIAFTGLTVAGLATGTTTWVLAEGKDSDARSAELQIQAAADIDRIPDGVRLCPVGDQVRQAVSMMRAVDYEHACDVRQQNYDRADTYRTVRAVSFIAAGVGLAGVIVSYVATGREDNVASSTGPKRARKPSSDFHAELVPIWGRDQRGLAVVGRF